MKKFALALAVVMTLGLAACNSSKATDSDSVKAEDTNNVEQTVEEDDTTPVVENDTNNAGQE